MEAFMKLHQLAHASFSISGDQVVPEFWTKYFCVDPDVARKKGEPFTTRHGQILTNRTGVWGIHSKSAVESDLLEPHLRYLIARLGLPRVDLREHVERTGAWMRFFCYWRNKKNNHKPNKPKKNKTKKKTHNKKKTKKPNTTKTTTKTQTNKTNRWAS